jgi:hypothetical protein
MARIHVERATSEMAVFDGELPLGERQLARLAAQLERRRALDKRAAAGRRAERSLRRNSVLPGEGGCGG